MVRFALAATAIVDTVLATELRAPAAARDGLVRDHIQAAVDRVYPALVRIDVVKESGDSGRMMKSRSTGSGVIISPDGTIVTNHHVAGRGSRITIRLANREELPAQLIGTDALSDLTILRINPADRREPHDPLPSAMFGDSDTLRIGDVVLAMGSPAGLSQSVTQGIVANLSLIPPGGAFRIEGESVGELIRWIGHDAIIYPGNSGGPLVNLAGEIVGINEIGVGGLGGAIPANIARTVAQEIIKHGSVARSWTGISVQPLLKTYTGEGGVMVGSVLPGSPADNAGIQPGDIITSLNGETIPPARAAEDIPAFNRLVFGLPVGAPVPVQGIRDGSPRAWTLTTAIREPSLPREEAIVPLGITVRPLTRISALERKRSTVDGAIVVGVREDGAAAQAKPDLRPGDLITGIGEHAIKGPADLHHICTDIVNREKSVQPVLVTFVRDAENIVTVVKLGPPTEGDRVGRPRHPWLGVKTQVLSRELAESLGAAAKKGVRVTYVFPGSPAEVAGLADGDLLFKLDGRVIPASSPTDEQVFESLILPYAVGTEITLEGQRAGEPLVARVPLGTIPGIAGDQEAFKDDVFEFTVRELLLAERIQRDLGMDVPGIMVNDVQPNGWAALAGITPGDVIVSIAGQTVRTVDDAERILRGVRDTRPKAVPFFLRRGVGSRFTEVEPRW